MPNLEKEERIKELREKLKGSKGVLLSDFTGLSVLEISDLRRKCRDASIQYEVVKNTLMRIAVKEAQVELLLPFLDGPVAMAFSDEDPIEGIRVITEFAKENEKPKILGGYLWGEMYGPAEIKRLSTLPPRDTLLTQTIGALQYPLMQFLLLLKNPLMRLVFQLKELEKTKTSSEGESHETPETKDQETQDSQTSKE
jgi:large subunit ribosomal protein L10